MGDCTHIPLLSFSLDDVTALRGESLLHQEDQGNPDDDLIKKEKTCASDSTLRAYYCIIYLG